MPNTLREHENHLYKNRSQYRVMFRLTFNSEECPPANPFTRQNHNRRFPFSISPQSLFVQLIPLPIVEFSVYRVGLQNELVQWFTVFPLPVHRELLRPAIQMVLQTCCYR